MTETKSCTKCKREKPLEQFSEGEGRHGRLARCKDCMNAASRVWREANRERARESVRAWRVNNRARHAAYQATYAAANRERLLETRRKSRAKAFADGKEYTKSTVRRAAVKAGMPVDLERVLCRDGMTCGICHREIPNRDTLTFDHIVPLTRGGEHTEENLRPAHRACNSWKGDRLDSELEAGPPPPSDYEWQARVEAQRRKRISDAQKGNKNGLGNKGPRGRKQSPEEVAARRAANKAKWAAKTPEERAAHAAKISAAKKGINTSAGNAKFIVDPEVRARAIAASASLRRGKKLSSEHARKISEGNKRAYASGKRAPRSKNVTGG